MSHTTRVHSVVIRTLVLVLILIAAGGCSHTKRQRNNQALKVTTAYIVEVEGLAGAPSEIVAKLKDKIARDILKHAFFIPPMNGPQEIGTAPLEAERIVGQRISRFFPTLSAAVDYSKEVAVPLRRIKINVAPPLPDGRFNLTIEIEAYQQARWISHVPPGNFRFPSDEEKQMGATSQASETYLPEVRDLLVTLSLK
jgi:hypothetical protein